MNALTFSQSVQHRRVLTLPIARGGLRISVVLFAGIASVGIVESVAHAIDRQPVLSAPLIDTTTDAAIAPPLVISQVYSALKLGDSGDFVRRLQEALAAEGYYDGPVSGFFGDQTQQAVIAFQTSNGLAADGVVGASTEAALFAEAMPNSELVQTGLDGDIVIALQERLAELGYYQGAIDGTFGSATQDAVARFQANNGLATDGVVGPATEAALRDPYAVTANSDSASEPPSTDSSSTSNPDTPTARTANPNDSILERGESGRNVIALQSQLQALGYYEGAIDGEYGETTEAAVLEFQRSQNLTADGLAGAQTLAKLDEAFFNLESDTPPAIANPAVAEPDLATATPALESTVPQVEPAAVVSVPTIPTLETPETPSTATPLPPQMPMQPAAPPASQGEFSVLQLQQQLQEQGFYNGPLDGIMNPLTEQAILEAQQANDLSTSDIMPGQL